MADSDRELPRRKILGGLATIGAAGAIAGAGTMAYWSDTERGRGNVAAGSLNLEHTGSSDGSSFSISASDLAPGEVVEVGYIDLKNTGTVTGYLDYEIVNVQNYENGRIDPEIESGDDTGGDPGQGNGELGDVLLIDAWVDEDLGSRDEDIHLTSGFVGLSGGDVETDVTMTPGEEFRIWVDAMIDPNAGSEYLDQVMTDSVVIDTAFHLNQDASV